MKDNRRRCSSTILFAIVHLGLLAGTGKSATIVAAEQTPSTSSLRGEKARFSIEEDVIEGTSRRLQTCQDIAKAKDCNNAAGCQWNGGDGCGDVATPQPTSISTPPPTSSPTNLSTAQPTDQPTSLAVSCSSVSNNAYAYNIMSSFMCVNCCCLSLSKFIMLTSFTLLLTNSFIYTHTSQHHLQHPIQ